MVAANATSAIVGIRVVVAASRESAWVASPRRELARRLPLQYERDHRSECERHAHARPGRPLRGAERGAGRAALRARAQRFQRYDTGPFALEPCIQETPLTGGAEITYLGKTPD
jgi:hypothetical protein